MIARITAVWWSETDPHSRRADVIVRDDHGVTHRCFVWTKDKDGTVNIRGQLLATRCKSAAGAWRHPLPRVALTLKAPNAAGWSEIQDAEILDAVKTPPPVETIA